MLKSDTTSHVVNLPYNQQQAQPEPQHSQPQQQGVQQLPQEGPRSPRGMENPPQQSPVSPPVARPDDQPTPAEPVSPTQEDKQQARAGMNGDPIVPSFLPCTYVMLNLNLA